MKKVIIVLPIYYGNLSELEWSVKNQVNYFRKNLKEYDWKIIISLNGKKEEKVWNKMQELTKKYPEVNSFYTPSQGKGYGVIEALIKFKTDINTYMDIDLTTDLSSFKPMINKIEQGNDLIVGSRYHKNSKIKRNLIRYLVSRTYHSLIAKIIMGLKVSDAQCGFKAMNKKIIENVLPLVENKIWFFDSELMYIAQKKGYSIKEVPVIWKENDVSILKVMAISLEFIKNMWRLKKRRI